MTYPRTVINVYKQQSKKSWTSCDLNTHIMSLHAHRCHYNARQTVRIRMKRIWSAWAACSNPSCCLLLKRDSVIVPSSPKTRMHIVVYIVCWVTDRRALSRYTGTGEYFKRGCEGEDKRRRSELVYRRLPELDSFQLYWTVQ